MQQNKITELVSIYSAILLMDQSQKHYAKCEKLDTTSIYSDPDEISSGYLGLGDEH
jgi:hypothetical protein